MKKHLKYLTTSLAMSTALGSMALAEDIKIGMVVTLSGPPAALGQQIVDGFQLALDEKDGMLGGQKIELIVEDDELKPDVALLKATSLVERDEVDFVVGTVFSNMLQAIFKPVVQSETFLVSPNAGPSTFAGRNCNPYFFVTSYQNNQNAEISGMIANEEGFESVFTMVPNYQAGRDNIEGFKQTFKGTVTDEVFTPLGHQDFSAELARISTSDADAVFTFMPGGMGVRLVNQFANAGLSENTKFMSVFTTDETTLPGQKDAAVGFLAAGSWAPDLANDANTAFVSAFEAKYGYVPGSYAMQAYDAASLIDSAVAKTGGDLSDKDAVRAALKEADFTSLRGDFSFNNNHYPVQDFHMLNVIKRDDGNYQTSFVRTIAEDYPDSFHQDCKM
ncbi:MULTISPECIES: ABC transporter substrate-binding protein [Sulfitobacter]|uniref:Leucine-, isoleucine-, valine-, threonine-, and alanine-binding protein n=1 Tax=Sulfitobacter dubius TaxID=218673 RepID=A0ABY3ZMJ2_9RHOB|nr:ABC transporter substrate-binding protein [Sulfitobacter dubius]UOA15828.1 Leucine-, isoleucine-, valine-, threonine-, and alanine-binding protein [Sulfitobacter dubius]WOI28782.1 ABC transporter substrate-binding protein [Sulfitobacter dubius]|tara:strand:- start:309 stop:1478 length:1170 start_codon:yes stop_codon:yes gene_type:complete